MPSRPRFLNLFQIRLPVPGLVSILHRVSGAALFLALPMLLYWWQLSFASFNTFSSVATLFSHWFVKLVLIGLLWCYLHHLCAGIRHLLMDLDVWTELAGARLSAKIVLIVSIALTIVAAVRLW